MKMSLFESEDDIAMLMDLSKCMRPMINALPETYRHALLLAEIEGKKHSEVAEELKISLSAAKSRILRGRDKLHASVLRCCRISQNSKGTIVDYEKKPGKHCQSC